MIGVVGLLPFVVATATIFAADRPWPAFALVFELQFGAIALSFLGAVHWGLAMANYGGESGWSRFAWSAAPALAGWIAIQLPPAGALMAMIAAFLATWLVDCRATDKGLAPDWYRRLRKPLTIVTLVCLGASLIAIGRVV